MSRIKKNASITITKIIRGIAKKNIGKGIKNLTYKRRARGSFIVELEGSIAIEKSMHSFRVIGFWNPATRIYHWYLTNLNVPAVAIYPLYRIRWTLELVFKSCKQSLNMNQIPSSCTNIIESLLLASLVAHLATHSVLELTVECLDKKEKILAVSIQRVTKVTTILAPEFIQFLTRPNGIYLQNLIRKILMFVNEIFDPNYKKRLTVLQSLEKLIVKKRKKSKGKILYFPQYKNKRVHEKLRWKKAA